MKSTEGSSLIIVITLVAIAMSVCVGIVELANRNFFEQHVRYAASASANAASFTYADVYLKELRACVNEQFEMRIEMDSDHLMQGCVQQGVETCLEDDLIGCQIELETCYEPEDSPIEFCQSDEGIHRTAKQAAQSAAKKVAEEYNVQLKGEIKVLGDLVHLTTEDKYSSLTSIHLEKTQILQGKSKMRVRQK